MGLYFIVFSLSLSMLSAKIKILGTSRCTEEQMKTYLLKKNPKVLEKYLHYIKYYLSEGEKEGIRGDLAFCQSLHETNFFKFGGDVIPEQNNFAGIGTIGGGEKGHFFKTPQEGIRAQIQHLKAYASKKPLILPCVDPRFQLVKNRGCAPYIEDLGGKWAFPGFDTKKYKTFKQAYRKHDTYGHKIVKIYNEIRKINCKKLSHKTFLHKK